MHARQWCVAHNEALSIMHGAHAMYGGVREEGTQGQYTVSPSVG